MELEPHNYSSKPIGSLSCETGDNFEIIPAESRIHFFNNGLYPCIEILDYDEQERNVYRITTHGILDAIAEYGVPAYTHEDDDTFRNQDIVAINSSENRFFEWDFLPKNAEQSVGQEVSALLREDGMLGEINLSKEDKLWLDQEIEPPIIEMSLPASNTILVEVDGWPELSYIATLDDEGVKAWDAIDEDSAKHMKEAGYYYRTMKPQDISDRTWEIIANIHMDAFFERFQELS